MTSKWKQLFNNLSYTGYQMPLWSIQDEIVDTAKLMKINVMYNGKWPECYVTPTLPWSVCAVLTVSLQGPRSPRTDLATLLTREARCPESIVQSPWNYSYHVSPFTFTRIGLSGQKHHECPASQQVQSQWNHSHHVTSFTLTRIGLSAQAKQHTYSASIIT